MSTTYNPDEPEDLTTGVGMCPGGPWEAENTSNPGAERCASCGMPRDGHEETAGDG